MLLWWLTDDERLPARMRAAVADGSVAGALPRHHDDPFDRMLIAQAALRGLQLLTVDRRFSDYDVRLL